MIITTSKHRLKPALEATVAATDGKSTMPALKCVLIEADGDSVTITGSDLFTTRREVLRDVEVKQPGSIAVFAKDLLVRVKNMPDGPVTLKVDGSRMVITAKGSSRKFTVSTMHAEDYPAVPKMSDDAVTLNIPRDALVAGISAVLKSASDDMTRPHINGVQIECEDGVVRFIATDAHRLPVTSIPVDRTGDAKVLVQKDACRHILKMIEKKESAEIFASSSHVFVVADGSMLSSKTLDAAFPPWRQVVPSSSERSVSVETERLADACRALSVSATNNGGRFVISDGELKIQTEHPDHGNAEDVLSVEYSGKSASIGLDLRFVVEALASVGGTTATIELSGELDPVVFSSEDGRTRAVLMPMRI